MNRYTQSAPSYDNGTSVVGNNDNAESLKMLKDSTIIIYFQISFGQLNGKVFQTMFFTRICFKISNSGVKGEEGAEQDELEKLFYQDEKT